MGEYAAERLTRVLEAIEQATVNCTSWVVAEHGGADRDTCKLWVDRVYDDLADALPDPYDLRRAVVLLLEERASQRAMELITATRAITGPDDMLDSESWSGPCRGCPQCQPTRWGAL